MKTGAILLILTSASSCKIDNLDHAEAQLTHVETMEECEKMAAAIDPRLSIRALCLPASIMEGKGDE